MTLLRIAIVDDSPFACQLLASFLESDPGLVFAGAAHNPTSALELIAKTKPDLVTLGAEIDRKSVG